MNKKISSSDMDINPIYFFLLYSIYVGVLGFIYWRYISTVFAYEGFYREYFSSDLIPVVAVNIFLLTVLPRKNGLVSSVSTIIYMLILAPTTVYVLLGPGTLTTLYVTTLAISIVMVVSTYANLRLPILGQISVNQIATGVLLLSAGYFVAVIAQGGLRYLNFNILDVYDYRGDAAENLLPIFGYISSNIGTVFIPFLVVYGISTKNTTVTAIGFSVGVFLFAFVSHKSPLFYGIVSAFLYLSYANSRKFSFYIITGLIIISIISALDFSLMLDPARRGGSFEGLFGSLIIRRAVIVPAQLNNAYVEFFSSNPNVWWSDSKISMGLLKYPYNSSVPYLIGHAIFGKINLGANTGFIGSGYAEAGVFGVILYSIMVGAMISLLKTRSSALSERFILSISFPVLFTVLLSSDLITSLLTHGVLLLLLLLSVARMPDLRERMNSAGAPTNSFEPMQRSRPAGLGARKRWP